MEIQIIEIKVINSTSAMISVLQSLRTRRVKIVSMEASESMEGPDYAILKISMEASAEKAVLIRAQLQKLTNEIEKTNQLSYDHRR